MRCFRVRAGGRQVVSCRLSISLTAIVLLASLDSQAVELRLPSIGATISVTDAETVCQSDVANSDNERRCSTLLPTQMLQGMSELTAAVYTTPQFRANVVFGQRREEGAGSLTHQGVVGFMSGTRKAAGQGAILEGFAPNTEYEQLIVQGHPTLRFVVRGFDWPEVTAVYIFFRGNNVVSLTVSGPRLNKKALKAVAESAANTIKMPADASGGFGEYWEERMGKRFGYLIVLVGMSVLIWRDTRRRRKLRFDGGANSASSPRG